MKARTLESKMVWESPDGERIIWKVLMEAEGKQYELKTFSRKVSDPGFIGEVETYTNERGDRFVKQVNKFQGDRT